MKSVTGGITTVEPISLSRATKILSGFVSSKNGASQDVGAYLRRASAAFTELKSFHREIKSSKKPRSDARQERNPTGEFEKLARDKESDNLVQSVSEDESVYEKKKKVKSKKKEEEEDVDEMVKEKKRKNDGEIGSEDRKSKKKRKSKET